MASKRAPVVKKVRGVLLPVGTGLVVASCGNAESGIGRDGRPLKANAVDPVLLQQLDLLLDGRENTARYSSGQSSIPMMGSGSSGEWGEGVMYTLRRSEDEEKSVGGGPSDSNDGLPISRGRRDSGTLWRR
jgi:hypothetical protein